MDEDIEEWIRDDMKEFQNELNELKWQKYLPPLPNILFSSEGDPRAGILLTLSWLLTDLFDNNWEEVTAEQLVQILRDTAYAIHHCTEK